jgi:hypothetical protein
LRLVLVLPRWMTSCIWIKGTRYSLADLVYLAAGAGLLVTERDWLYREGDATGTD